MSRLRHKIFYTVFGILTIALLGFQILFNVQNYNEQKNTIKRAINYANQLKNSSLEKSNRNVRFMDTSIVTIKLDDDNNILEIINHTNEEIPEDKVREIANSILKNDDLEKEHIGFLYRDKYSYSYRKGTSLVIIDNFFVQENLKGLFRETCIFFIILEIIFVFVAKLIAHWISSPAEEAFIKQKNFIADASHELKTPLSIITASAEALEKNPMEKKWLNNIKNESERMNNLVIDLLDLAKTENGRMELSVGNLSKAVELSVLAFEGIAFERGIKLEYHIDDNINIKMNDNAIKQVMEILLDNAIKHSKKNGIVEVSLTDGNAIELIVSNLGVAIPKGEEKKIFDRFYRADKSRNRNDNRYGLGLAIAKNIVNIHKGTINAYSKNGKTFFQVSLKK